ncbi:MAG: hypothetical protein R2712_27040 [Vicinamibacterales bacterium]
MGVAVTLTGVGILWLVGIVALYRTVTGKPGPGHAPTLLTFGALVVMLSWLARSVR